MEKERRFKAGDTVTYRFTRDLPNNKYNYGGECQGDYKGIIKEYRIYNEGAKCWSILVTSGKDWCFSMLESEFLEFGTPKKKETKKKETKKTTTINDYSIW